MGVHDFGMERDHDEKLISDTKRYQMLGSNVAVPCVAYIVQGIRDIIDEGGEVKIMPSQFRRT